MKLTETRTCPRCENDSAPTEPCQAATCAACSVVLPLVFPFISSYIIAALYQPTLCASLIWSLSIARRALRPHHSNNNNHHHKMASLKRSIRTTPALAGYGFEVRTLDPQGSSQRSVGEVELRIENHQLIEENSSLWFFVWSVWRR